MWLLKAVGVHDQLEFTFALERGRTYTIGRDKGCNIQFTSKRLRLQEGSLEVGDWTTTDPFQKPFVKYRPEPKKGKKECPPYKSTLLSDDAEAGSTRLEDYEIVTLDNGTQGAFLSDHDGQGVYFDDDAWFTLFWRDLYVVWDKMKDETDELRDALKSYCVPWSPAFDTNRIPDFVFSNTYKANPECNYAVCYGVRILVPEYLREIVGRLSGCWKNRADGEDSFKLPDVEDEKYTPGFDTALQAFRANKESWLPDPRRPTLFNGWKILVLRSKATPGERRFLLAAGADLTDLDIVSEPLASPADLEGRMSAWLADVDSHEGGREKAVVAHFGLVKKSLTEAGKDFSVYVEAPCHRLGLAVAPGSIIWNAMRHGGVRRYLEDAATNVPKNKSEENKPEEKAPAPRLLRRTQVPETAAPPTQRLPTPPPEVTSAGPSQSSGSPSQRRSYVPGSVGDEASAITPTERATDVDMAEETPPSAQPTSTAKRALKRRVGKPMADLYVEPIAETPLDSGGNSPLSPPLSQDRPSQVPPPAAQPAPSQSFIPDSMMPSQSQSATGGRSRLKRRAGTQQPIVDYTIPETAPSSATTQSMKPEVMEIYEQAMQKTDQQPAAKRARLAQIDESREHTPASTQVSNGGMEVDEEEEEEPLDFVEKTLGQAAKARREGRHPSGILMPPPAQIPTRAKNGRGVTRPPSEESEMIEPPRKAKTRAQSPTKELAKRQAAQQQSSAAKTLNGQSHPPASQDTAFLQAIAKKSKSRNAIDELDKEFNQLRIPKPGGNPGQNIVNASAWDANHPDWNMVNDFDDGMRGNFIEIIRVDLMRKDGGRKEATTTDDGTPNFKKFKKKNVIRREPVRLALAAPTANDPDMGEPYWPTQQSSGRKGKGPTQMIQPEEEEDDEMPLLPTNRRRLLDNNNGEDDDMTPLPSSSRTRGRGTVEPNSQVPSQASRAVGARAGRATQSRQVRESSVTSEVSSVGGRATRTTKPAKVPSKSASATQSNRSGRVNTIVIEESEDEVNQGIGPARSSTGTGTRGKSTRVAGTSEAGPTASGRVGDDEATTATASTRAKSQSTLGATGRRRLLVADDDDDGEMVFKGAAKKRRV